MSELKIDIEHISIEADRQESALLQQIILFDIMSLTDPGREPNDDYPTLTRLRDEVRLSDEIYRLLYKRGSLFQGDGLQDLKKEHRHLLLCLVRQVLDLIEDHHAKIRSKSPRYSFPVEPSLYEDMFYIKVPPVETEDQSALEMLAAASTIEDENDDDEDETDVEESPRRPPVSPQASQRAQSMKQGAISKKQSVQKSSPRQSTKQQQPQPGAMPKLFPDQRMYQLIRSPSKGWQVTTAGGVPVNPPVLRKRTHFYENPNYLGAVTAGRTISVVTDEDEDEDLEAEAAATSSENSMRQRIQGINPIFVSHFGPDTRPPASQVKHDPTSTLPVSTTTPDTSQGYYRPNVLAYIEGTIPRAKSVRPTRASEAAAVAGTKRATITPPRGQPSTAEAGPSGTKPSPSARPSTAPTTTTARKSQVPPEKSSSVPVTPRRSLDDGLPVPRKSLVSADGSLPVTRKSLIFTEERLPRKSLIDMEESLPMITPRKSLISTDGSFPVPRKSLMISTDGSLLTSVSASSPGRSRVTFGPDEVASETPQVARRISISPGPQRRGPAVKFADEGEELALPEAVVTRKPSFIEVAAKLESGGPSYGRIRDFPVVVPSILNSAVGLAFPENEEIFSAPEEDEVAEQE